MPSAPSFFFSNLSEPSPAVLKCRKKSWTLAVVFGQPVGMFHLPFHFVRDDAALQSRLFHSNSSAVPAAARVEALNRHSLLRGNDPAQAGGQTVRVQRVFCSNRGQRGGCGGTFSIVLTEVLPRHTLTASLVWRGWWNCWPGFWSRPPWRTAPAICLGNGLSAAASVAARIGSGADATLPGAVTSVEPAIPPAVANRGASAVGVF